MKLHYKLLSTVLICAMPFLAHAESNFPARASATAHVDFKIIIVAAKRQ